MNEVNIEEIMEIPKSYYIFSEPKLKISKAIKEQLDQKELSIRGLGRNLEMKHQQIVRVTSGENYNIDTLLKILDGLDLEITLQPKSK